MEISDHCNISMWTFFAMGNYFVAAWIPSPLVKITFIAELFIKSQDRVKYRIVRAGA